MSALCDLFRMDFMMQITGPVERGHWWKVPHPPYFAHIGKRTEIRNIKANTSALLKKTPPPHEYFDLPPSMKSLIRPSIIDHCLIE